MNNTNKYILELETKLKELQEKEASWIKEQEAQIKVFKEKDKEIKQLNQVVNNLEKQIEQSDDLDVEQNEKWTKKEQESKKRIKDLERDNGKLYTALQDSSQLIKEKENSLREVQQKLLAQEEKNRILEEKLFEAEKQAQESILPPPISINEEWEKEKEELLTQFEKTRNEQANEIIKLEKENNQLDQDLNNAVDELENRDKELEQSEQKIKEDEKKIKELEAELKERYKTISELEKKVKSKGEVKELFTCYHCKKQQELSLLVLELPEGKLCQPCWQLLRKKTKEQIKETPKENIPFTCHNCQETKKEKSFRVKLDATLIEYPICSACLPTIKEYNEKEQDSERELDIWE